MYSNVTQDIMDRVISATVKSCNDSGEESLPNQAPKCILHRPEPMPYTECVTKHQFNQIVSYFNSKITSFIPR